MEEYLTAVRDHVTSHLNGITPPDDQDLFAAGYLNSLFAVQIVAWIEKEFGATLASDDLRIDNFRSIDSIASFIDRKLSPVAG